MFSGSLSRRYRQDGCDFLTLLTVDGRDPTPSAQASLTQSRRSAQPTSRRSRILLVCLTLSPQADGLDDFRSPNRAGFPVVTKPSDSGGITVHSGREGVVRRRLCLTPDLNTTRYRKTNERLMLVMRSGKINMSRSFDSELILLELSLGFHTRGSGGGHKCFDATGGRQFPVSAVSLDAPTPLMRQILFLVSSNGR